MTLRPVSTLESGLLVFPIQADLPCGELTPILHSVLKSVLKDRFHGLPLLSKSAPNCYS